MVAKQDRTIGFPGRFAQPPPRLDGAGVAVVALLEPDLLLGCVREMLEDGAYRLRLFVEERIFLRELDPPPPPVSEDRRFMCLPPIAGTVAPRPQPLDCRIGRVVVARCDNSLR